jgi:uncharacterized protein (DUF2062 family)
MSAIPPPFESVSPAQGLVHWRRTADARVTSGLRNRILEPLFAMLRHGMQPDRLALCVAIGVVVGNIPILGVSSVLCTVIALVFRLNLPAIQIVQWAMAPTQLLLIIPFVRLGEWILRAPHQPLSIKAGLELIAQGAGHAVVVLWDAILHAGFAWILTAPLATLSLYRLLTPLFTRVAAKIRARGAAETPPTPTVITR